MSAGQYSGMVDCLAQTAKVCTKFRAWLSVALFLANVGSMSLFVILIFCVVSPE